MDKLGSPQDCLAFLLHDEPYKSIRKESLSGMPG